MNDNYFFDVYLKRMNRDGLNQQERVKTKKEKEFDKLFLKKTEYQVRLYGVNGEQRNDICSLQPNKWNESNLIGNLLMSTHAAPLKTGDILNIYQKIKDVEYDKIWLVFFVEENITKGYQLFKCLCLDEEINITNEYGNTIQSLPVKFINASSQFIIDTFSFTNGAGYREPNMQRGFVTANNEILKKGQYFNYKDKGWEITGKDDISIQNVVYTFIGEKLKREEEPRSSEDILVGEDTNFFLNGR